MYVLQNGEAAWVCEDCREGKFFKVSDQDNPLRTVTDKQTIDYFAAMALSGVLSAGDVDSPIKVASAAYAIGRAMAAERDKP